MGAESAELYAPKHTVDLNKGNDSEELKVTTPPSTGIQEWRAAINAMKGLDKNDRDTGTGKTSIVDSLHEVPKQQDPIERLLRRSQEERKLEPAKQIERPPTKSPKELSDEFSDAFKKYNAGDKDAFKQFDLDLKNKLERASQTFGIDGIISAINANLPDGQGLLVENQNTHGPDDFSHYSIHKIQQLPEEQKANASGVDEKYGAYKELGRATAVTISPDWMRRQEFLKGPGEKIIHWD